MLAEIRSLFNLLERISLPCSSFFYALGYVCWLFVVITFAYTELQAFLTGAEQSILAFRKSLTSFHSFFFLFSSFSLTIPFSRIPSLFALSNVDLNVSVLTSLLVPFDTAAFEAKVNFLEHPVRNFSQ